MKGIKERQFHWPESPHLRFEVPHHKCGVHRTGGYLLHRRAEVKRVYQAFVTLEVTLESRILEAKKNGLLLNKQEWIIKWKWMNEYESMNEHEWTFQAFSQT